MRYLRLMAYFLVIYSIGLWIGFGYFALRDKANQNPFVWGVNMGAFALNTINDPYQPNNVDQQIELLKQLGVNTVRINLEINKFLIPGEPRDNVNDDLIDRLTKAGFKILLIIEDPFQPGELFKFGNQDNGWAWGYKVASRYKGKIFAYQLANEVSGMTIKEGHAGRTIDDFDPKKYRVLKEWLTGLSNGIHEADPKAKRVISAHWVATAVIDELITDQVQFEVIGWNWFSDMGNNPTNKTFEDGTIIDIPGHFAGKGKSFWFTELNRSHGSIGADGNTQQAEFIKTAIQAIKQSPHVSGIFVYTLLDDQEAPTDTDRHWGLVEVAQPMIGKYVPEDVKPAFQAYRAVIKTPS